MRNNNAIIKFVQIQSVKIPLPLIIKNMACPSQCSKADSLLDVFACPEEYRAACNFGKRLRRFCYGCFIEFTEERAEEVSDTEDEDDEDEEKGLREQKIVYRHPKSGARPQKCPVCEIAIFCGPECEQKVRPFHKRSCKPLKDIEKDVKSLLCNGSGGKCIQLLRKTLGSSSTGTFTAPN